MAISQALKTLWFTGIVFLILPQFNLGQLSDYKICGDSECESLMSRVQAIRDHSGRDCRFLSFRRGDTIFVYHKLTGKREDLWAGSIDKQFGYFPKDSVQEEQVYATTEKVVETQKSDFFCFDESGNFIESGHLDNSDDNDDNSFKKIQNQESETTQAVVNTDDSSAESPSTSIDPSAGSLQKPDGTATEEDGSKNAGDTAATTHGETQETAAVSSKQGGSPSSSWLGSSVTGWLSLGKEEQPGTLAEGDKKDEREKTQAEASLTSSVTGWLGFGGEGKPDDAVNNRVKDKETGASFSSTMTGWLGFGGEKQSDSAKKEQHNKIETGDESEPKETFRSRRMSLDLEGSQLQEEEKDTGTLAWLGNGLSSTLGFGMTKQESEPIKKEKEKTASTSWLDIGVGDMLGFGKYKSEVDESTRNGFKGAETDTTSENAEISQSQPAQTEEEKTEPDIQILDENVGMDSGSEVGLNINKSNLEEHNQVPQSETDSSTLAPNVFDNNRDASASSKDSILSADSVSRVDEENISTQTMLEVMPRAVGEMSSVKDQKESVESEGEEHEMHKPIGNEGEDENREPEEEEITIANDNDKDFLTESDTDLGSDIYSVESKEQSAVNIKEGTKDQLQRKTADSLEETTAKIPNQVGNTEEDMSLESGLNNAGHEGEKSNSDVPHREIYRSLMNQTEQSRTKAKQSQVKDYAEGSREMSQSYSVSLHTDMEGNEPTHSEDDNATAHSVTTDPNNLGTVAMINDRSTDREPHHGAIAQDEGAHSVKSSSEEFESSHSENKSTESLKGSASEDQTLPVTLESTDHDSGSLKTKEVEVLKEEEKHEELKEVEEMREGDRQHAVEEGKQEVVQINDEMREEVYMLQKEETQENEEELKEEEGQKKQKQKKEEELKKEEKQQEDGDLKGEKRQDEIGMEKREKENQEVEELKEEEKGEQVVEVKEKEKWEGLGDVEELGEEENRDQVREVMQEVKQDKAKVAQVEEKQAIVGEFEEEKKQKIPGLKVEEKPTEMEELKEETKQKDVQTEEEKGEEKCSHDIGKPDSESSEKEAHDDVEKTKEERRKTKPVNVEQAEEMQQVNDTKGERRDRKQEANLKCSNKHLHDATESDSVMDTSENISGEGASSTNKETIQRRRQSYHMLVDRTGAQRTVTSEGTKRKKLGEEEMGKTSTDSEADEGHKNIMLNASGHEDIYGNGANMSNHKDLVVEQIGNANEMWQTAEAEGQDHRYTLSQGHKELKREGSVNSSNKMSSDKINSEHESDSEESHKDQTVPHIFQDPDGSSVPSGDQNRDVAAENENTGAFGLFKNAFSFLSRTPVTKTKDTTESVKSLDTDTAETSEPQASLTPKQEPDFKTHSSQDSVKDGHKDTPLSIPTQQHRHGPHSPETLSKHYKNLLSHVSPDELRVLMDSFGRHKLQFLDYILGRSESVTDDPDSDESILLDIGRLLHHQKETLVSPDISLADAPQENNEKAEVLIAFEKLEMLLGKLRETFNTRKSDITKVNLQAEASCVGASCSTHSQLKKTQDSSVAQENKIQRDEQKPFEKDTEDTLTQASQTEEWERGHKEMKEELVIPESHPHIQQGSPQPLEGMLRQTLDMIHPIAKDSVTHAHAVRELIIWITVQVVSLLPDDIRPGPDLYGVPWEPVIISAFVGLLTMLLFTCRCYSSVKSRMYQSRERWMAEQVAQLLDEKCKVLETLSECQQEYDDLEDSLRDSGVLAQTQKTEELEIKARQMEHDKNELDRDIEQLKDQLEQQQEHRIEQERMIAVLEDSIKTLEDETKDLQAQEEQAQTTLKVYSMNSDRLQRNLETAGEENTLLQESNAQLRQQVEGWAERVSELEAEMRRCEVTYSGMQQDVANKDERITSLTDHLLRMKAWDSGLEEEEEGKGGKKETSNGTAGKGAMSEQGDTTDPQGHLQKVQKLIYAAKLNADLKSLDEDKDRVFAKLNDEVKAKEDLQESMKEMENEKLSLQSEAEHYTDQVQRLQQKLQIMTEMYQENELKLHRLLTVEERERLQKEEKLNKADKNIAMAIEEVNNYRQRAEEMEEELEKTRQSYQTQISAHEKKAHNNWLAARAAERELADIRRENALFRQKLTDTQFKMDTIDKDPYALDSLARPLPFRAERSTYGPSPLGRPASETRPFLSPPTLMEGPPTRLSPRVSRGPVEPPGGQGELGRSGGPHSDSGSISPTWERDRRGPPLGLPPGPLGPPGPIAPPGYMFPEPGGPMYRRPPPPPGAIGILPPPGSLPPGPPHPRGFPSAPPPGPPHPTEMADGPYRENRLTAGEQEHRESGPGDRRTPPEEDPRMGGPPPPGPPLGSMDGPFPRRGPYGPPPPDFYPPRGPGGPPMRPMWASPPTGMMFRPRFPPGGAPLPPAPHPHYAPAMRHPAPDGLPPPSAGPAPPQQSFPSPPHSQSPEEHTASPEDAI